MLDPYALIDESSWSKHARHSHGPMASNVIKEEEEICVIEQDPPVELDELPDGIVVMGEQVLLVHLTLCPSGPLVLRLPCNASLLSLIDCMFGWMTWTSYMSVWMIWMLANAS